MRKKTRPARIRSWLDRVRRVAARFGAGLLVLALAGGALDTAFPPDLKPLANSSTLVVDRGGRILRGFTNSDGVWRLPARVRDVDPLYIRMLIAYEDRRFREHPGVDPIAAVRALGQAVAAGRIVSGASTLTMQTARLLEPRPRTLGAKLIEAFRALQLENRRGKDAILSMYLTLAPYGGNLEGIRAASLAYFGKEPKRLTPAEAALLVVLPQNPTGYRPDSHPKAARAARDKVLRRMAERGILSARAAREAMEAPVPARRHAMPFLAPHLARRLVAEMGVTETETATKKGAGGRVIATTIDGELQAAMERLARSAAGELETKATVAILVVDNKARAVRAYVGSSDFFARGRAGQVDMIEAVRSPGSTLKPFVYGLAFDDGILHPATILADVPTRFGDYRPQNFGHSFHGDVSAREALQQSLNVPAVKVLEKVGPARLAARLRLAGAKLAFDARAAKPGLPLALGGVGITLHDLTKLYVGLADGGRAGPLRLRQGSTKGAAIGAGGTQGLMSPAAAWQIARILEAAPPPTDYVASINLRRARPIAYKTGTSYGFRDAWAVGYDARYTVGVWTGRPDGTPSPERYGRNTAAPILFRAFGLLPRSERAMPGPRPPGVVIASNSELPARLRRFGAPRETGQAALTATAPLAIAFPPNGAVIELERGARNRGFVTLPLAAEGGRAPLTWLVNGRPVESRAYRRSANWVPDGPGFVRVTVIDADGHVAISESRLK